MSGIVLANSVRCRILLSKPSEIRWAYPNDSQIQSDMFQSLISMIIKLNEIE